MTEAPHRRARAPDVPPLARALVAAVRAVPFAFTLGLAVTSVAALATGREVEAAAFGGAFLLAFSVASRVALLEHAGAKRRR